MTSTLDTNAGRGVSAGVTSVMERAVIFNSLVACQDVPDVDFSIATLNCNLPARRPLWFSDL